MFGTPVYRVELRIDGVLVGDVRPLAQDLNWVRRRTRVGVDEITFTLNDVLFARWCEQHGYTINQLLKPLALDCRVIRDGVAVMGGFLATMPGYSPNGVSSSLKMKFDGYLNYLAGVYIRPTATTNARMGEMVAGWINEAERRATEAGKGFGFKARHISDLAKVTQTFSNYKTVKDAITDRCDNTSGAGPFDVYFHEDRTFDVYGDSEFGDEITDYRIQYPQRLNGVSASKISASELAGFSSFVIGIGAGEISEVPEENTAIVSERVNRKAVMEYGYAETIMQNSSVSRQTTLDANTETRLAALSDISWQPQISLSGRQVAPVPTGTGKIWVGDTVTLQNSQDVTGMTNGRFRVNELAVKVSAANGEVIKPTLSRGMAANNTSFTSEIVALKRELLNIKTV